MYIRVYDKASAAKATTKPSCALSTSSSPWYNSAGDKRIISALSTSLGASQPVQTNGTPRTEHPTPNRYQHRGVNRNPHRTDQTNPNNTPTNRFSIIVSDHRKFAFSQPGAENSCQRVSITECFGF
jgi:hypothetical protein